MQAALERTTFKALYMLFNAERSNLTAYPFACVNIADLFHLITQGQLPSGLVAQLVEQR